VLAAKSAALNPSLMELLLPDFGCCGNI